MMYELDGKVQHMSEDELRSIERLGDPHRVQDYAIGMHASAYRGIGGLGAMAREMKARTGATEVGRFPSESFMRIPVNAVLASKTNIVHLSGYSCCNARKGRLELDNAGFAFVSKRSPHKICGHCAAKFGEIRFSL